MCATVIVSAVILRDAKGKVLTVRKRGTSAFMLPGGKPEPGEDAAATAIREIREEVGLHLDPVLLRPVGTYTAAAANEAGVDVVATVFEHPLGPFTPPTSEIEELRWWDPSREPHAAEQAPLNTEIIGPLLTRRFRSLAIYTGSRPGSSQRYLELAQTVGIGLAKAGIEIIYGGGAVGMMGAVADAALAAGGRVTGVIPHHLVDAELAHPRLSRLEIVNSMSERKQRMAALADGFVALPGGVGTLDEIFEEWTNQQLAVHHKPVAFYDVGFWGPLLGALAHIGAEGFIRDEDRDGVIVANSVDSLLRRLERWTPPSPTWS